MMESVTESSSTVGTREAQGGQRARVRKLQRRFDEGEADSSLISMPSQGGGWNTNEP